jgi:hypothetical protein
MPTAFAPRVDELGEVHREPGYSATVTARSSPTRDARGHEAIDLAGLDLRIREGKARELGIARS